MIDMHMNSFGEIYNILLLMQFLKLLFLKVIFSYFLDFSKNEEQDS